VKSWSGKARQSRAQRGLAELSRGRNTPAVPAMAWMVSIGYYLSRASEMTPGVTMLTRVEGLPLLSGNL
jgi:hypothetical protein